MKKILFPVLICITLASCEKKATSPATTSENKSDLSASSLPSTEEKITLDTPEAKVSYSIGVDIGRNIKRSTEDLSLQALHIGLRDGFQGNTNTLLNDQEMREVIMNYRKDLMTKR